MKDAQITSPEAQVINAPTLVGLLNGMMSLVDTGLNECFGGFAFRAVSKLIMNKYLISLWTYFSHIPVSFRQLQLVPKHKHI